MNEQDKTELHTLNKSKKFIIAALKILMILIASALVLFVVLKFFNI